MATVLHPAASIHAHAMARREAIVLADLAAKGWPEFLMSGYGTIVDQITERAAAFAANGRRVLEAMGWTGPVAEPAKEIIPGVDVKRLCDLRQAPDYAYHSASLQIQFAEVPENIARFTGMAAFSPDFLRCDTETCRAQGSLYDTASASLEQTKLTFKHLEAEDGRTR